MRIHLIAIGGSAMHNLAMALFEKGVTVTGSDDEIFEPARSRLKKYDLLPEEIGWFPDRISPDLDAVILGMHAREDNPELIKAKKMGIQIFSYPEYLYEQTKEKKRVVIAGSHGKTTITSMIMHVLKHSGYDFDYMVGAQVEGFETMVKLSDQSPIAIFEGDEYLSSPIDKRPKFHLYKPHIALITGIAWDHINVFPTFEIYKDQFTKFIDSMEHHGTLYYFAEDPVLVEIIVKNTNNLNKVPYGKHDHMVRDHDAYLLTQSGSYKLHVFGSHNMQNLNGAKLICNQLGVSDLEFYKAMVSFKGAAKRLQVLKSDDHCTVYLDFAHAPSKVKATVNAVKENYPERKLIACLELHTFSSLNIEFLDQYKDTLMAADIPIVYFNPETLVHKKLAVITPAQIKNAFGGKLEVFTNSSDLVFFLKSNKYININLLLMSSGNFGGLDLTALSKELISST